MSVRPKQTVEAKTRKLSARWTFEAAQDARDAWFNVEAEVMAALAQEITAETIKKSVPFTSLAPGIVSNPINNLVHQHLLETNMRHWL